MQYYLLTYLVILHECIVFYYKLPYNPCLSFECHIYKYKNQILQKITRKQKNNLEIMYTYMVPYIDLFSYFIWMYCILS